MGRRPNPTPTPDQLRSRLRQREAKLNRKLSQDLYYDEALELLDLAAFHRLAPGAREAWIKTIRELVAQVRPLDVVKAQQKIFQDESQEGQK